MGESNEASAAVMAVELRMMKAQLANLDPLINEMRAFMAESRAMMSVSRAAEARFRAEDWPEMKGRVGKLETRVTDLEGFRWKIIGAVTAAGAVSGVLGALVQVAIALLGQS